MHQIGVVGLSYRHVGVDEVARFSVPKAEIAARLPALRDALGVSEVFYVGTCNRVEVLYSMADGAPAGDARQEVFRALIGREPKAGEATRVLRAWTGEAAVEHLVLVTPPALGALALAAGGSAPLLDAAALAKIPQAAAASPPAPGTAPRPNGALAPPPPPLLLDFGVPPNADPEGTRAAGIARVGMD